MPQRRPPGNGNIRHEYLISCYRCRSGYNTAANEHLPGLPEVKYTRNYSGTILTYLIGCTQAQFEAYYYMGPYNCIGIYVCFICLFICFYLYITHQYFRIEKKIIENVSMIWLFLKFN